jgi:chromosomal replication initiation ATPase DnaA
MSDALLTLLQKRHPERWRQKPAPAVTPAPLPRVRDWLLLTSATPGNHIQIKTVIAAVAEHYGISASDIISSRRTANVVRPRQVAMYLAKTLTLRSLPEIGRRFGGRDHTTVLHAVRKIEGLLKQDSQLAADIAGIQRRIGTPMQEAA